jgi:hypothetical protein
MHIVCVREKLEGTQYKLTTEMAQKSRDSMLLIGARVLGGFSCIAGVCRAHISTYVKLLTLAQLRRVTFSQESIPMLAKSSAIQFSSCGHIRVHNGCFAGLSSHQSLEPLNVRSSTHFPSLALGLVQKLVVESQSGITTNRVKLRIQLQSTN